MKFSEWHSQFSQKYKRYIDELAEMGRDTAQTGFDAYPPEYGNGGVTVSVEYDGETDFVLRASGEDAAFIEFGTGVETVVTRPTVRADFSISPGSWSSEHDGPFSKTGFWRYRGKKIAGTPPAGAMQDACSEMQNWSPTIAGRIFR